MSKLLDGLNPAQREAVTHKDGPLLIIAGPGSGKTLTVAHSIAYAIKNGVQPDRILAFSFTGKACEELRKRVIKLAGKQKGNLVQISTFHSFCRQVLRKDIEELHKGYTQNFKELKSKDQRIEIKKEITKVRARINHLQHHKFPNTKEILDFIIRCKLRFIPPSQAREHAPNPEMSEVYVEIYERYESLLEDNGWIDYANQLLLTNELFKDVDNVRTKWQESLDLIFVDEYQDTDPVQYSITTTLAERHQNLRVVGDDDQGIYGFRGADIQNILNFEKDHPHATLISLGQNHRSTQRIVATSRALAEFNLDRREKELFTRNLEGEKVRHLHCTNAEEEATTITSLIIKVIQYGWSFKDFAILCRLNDQVTKFETIFDSLKIPHGVDGVSVMTIHGAKGLEFPNVFVAGVCKGLLPFTDNEENEERRLLYVAMTRAQNWLCLSSHESDSRSAANGKSPFLDQIPENLLDPIRTLGAFHIPPKPNRTKLSTMAAEPLESITRPPIRAETVLGIDPGKIDANKPNVGWAITQKSSEGYTVINCNTETPIGGPDDKLRQIEHQINKLIASYEPDAIAVEKLKGATDEGLSGVAGCVALVRYIADQHGIECAFYSPQQVKYAATGNRNAGKAQVQEGVKKRCTFQMLQNTDNMDDHSADAIAASLCYLDNYLNSSRLQRKKRKQEHCNFGIACLKDKRYGKAITEYKKATDIDPICAETHYWLGCAYLGQGNLEAGKNAAKKAIGFKDNHYPDAQILLDAIGCYRSGLNFLINRQYDSAIAKFKNAVNKEPIFSVAHYRLSKAYLGQGNTEEAQNAVEETIRIKDDYPDARNLLEVIEHYHLGLNFFNNEQYDSAIAKFKEAIDEESIFTEAHYRLGYAYFRKNMLEAAEKSTNYTLVLNTNYPPALELQGKIKGAYVDKGHICLEQGSLTIAKTFANRALDLDVNYPPAHSLLEDIQKVDYVNNGNTCYEQGDLDAAKTYANKALELDENYLPALELRGKIKGTYIDKGHASYKQDDLDAAKIYANKALEFNEKPQLSDVARALLTNIGKQHYSQGLVYIADGAFDSAVESLQKASDVDPDDKDVWASLGRAYYWLDDYAKAVSCYKKAAKLDPQDKTIHNNLGNAYYWMGTCDKAIISLQKAKDIDPNCEKTLYYLARSYFKLGNLVEAKQAAKKALHIVPTYQDALELLEDIEEKRKLTSTNTMVLILGASCWIDKELVTNAQYLKFVDSNPRWRKDNIDRYYDEDGDYLKHWDGNHYPVGEGDKPVVHASWYAATAYAQWVEKRLPTEAEWRNAVRDSSLWEWCLDEETQTDGPEQRVRVANIFWSSPSSTRLPIGFRCARSGTD